MDTNLDQQALRDRLGVCLYRQRINIQVHHATQEIGQGRTLWHPENSALLRVVLTVLLKITGLYRLAKANARAIQVRENRVVLRRLPPSFAGFRLLHLSDLHMDLEPSITDALIGCLGKVDADACVITGDFRAETSGDFEPALREIERLMPHLNMPVYGVLGNHDFLEMVPYLEGVGIKVLLNENVPIERDGATIFLAGVDDPHFYETSNFEQALEGIPAEATKILLSHSAEPLHQALASGIDYMLSGHTHGGQICLPGGFPILHNARHPRSMARGPWSFLSLQGYTSRGVGCSMVPLRLFCPPEIAVHILERVECPSVPSENTATLS